MLPRRDIQVELGSANSDLAVALLPTRVILISVAVFASTTPWISFHLVDHGALPAARPRSLLSFFNALPPSGVAPSFCNRARPFNIMCHASIERRIPVPVSIPSSSRPPEGQQYSGCSCALHQEQGSSTTGINRLNLSFGGRLLSSLQWTQTTSTALVIESDNTFTTDI